MNRYLRKKYLKPSIFIIIILGFISLGYALISTNLTINGVSKIDKMTWDVHFENINVEQGALLASTPATINNKTTVNFKVGLQKLTDCYEFTVDVVNKGSISAMIGDINKTSLTTEQQKYLSYQATYADINSTPINKKDKLATGDKRSIRVVVKYKDGITKEDIPTNTEVINFSYNIDYVQADKTANDVILSHSFAVKLNGGSTTQNFASSYLTNQEITLVEPTRTGYRFTGWEVAKGNGTINGNKFIMGSQDTTIRAKWSNAPAAKYCTYDGAMTQGAQYTNGKYTYVYKQEKSYNDLKNIDEDGWGVYLTDKESTEPVTDTICTYINNKPVVSMTFMFAESQATSIDLSSSNTSNVTNMSFMFYKCAATSIDVSHLDTHKVTNMINMFGGNMLSSCKATELDLSSFDTSNVNSMGGMFTYSEAISINGLNGFDTSNITSMDGMFDNSQAITLDVSHFDTSKVTDMSNMFSSCKATSLDVSSFDTSQVTDMYMMFSFCPATTLDVSGFDTSQVTEMRNMFTGTKVTTLDVSNFDTRKVTSMYGLFSSMPLQTLDLSSFDTRNVTDMSYMFNYNEATTLNISNFDTRKVTNMDGMFSGSYATELDLSNFDTSNVTTMRSMFYESRTTSIKGLNNFDTSQVTNMREMFQNSYATSLDLSSFNTSKVTNMDFMFKSSKANKLDLSSFNLDKLSSHEVYYNGENVNSDGMFGIFEYCAATTGYARTQTDADKFNNTSQTKIPNSLHFEVK